MEVKRPSKATQIVDPFFLDSSILYTFLENHYFLFIVTEPSQTYVIEKEKSYSSY